VNGRLQQLAARRERLVALAAIQRDQLDVAAANLRRDIAVPEAALSLLRTMGRYRALAGVTAGALAILAPRALRRWLPWLVASVPIAIEARRLVLAVRRAKPAVGEL
jgi:hypothetical protein